MDYNQIIVQFDPEMFRCTICASIFESPVVDSCNHTYCSSCLNNWLQIGTFCPLSRLPIAKSSLRRLKLVDKIMEGTVVCKNTFDGCRWVGSISKYGDHIDSCTVESLKDKTLPVFDLLCNTLPLQFKSVKYAHDRYDGQMLFSAIQGLGKLFYLNGDIFEGVFHRNLKNGPGKYYFKMGGVYYGDWSEGMIEEGGRFVDASGTEHCFDSQIRLEAWMRVYSNDSRTINLK